MKKINFNLEQWKSGGYDVVTRGGSIVEMGTYSDKGILAWVGGVGYGWPVDGKYMEGETTGLDLFLKEKARVVYINITKTIDGEIRVYGTVDVKPRGPYKGAELIKSLEVEI